MKKIILLITFVFVGTTLFAQKKAKIKGNKNVEFTKGIISDPFNAIEIDDALEVDLYQTGETKYSLNTDSNLVDIVKFTVKDSILQIYTTNKITSNKKLDISLNIAKVNYITLKNNAKLNGLSKIMSDSIHLNAYNSCRFNLDIAADDIFVTLQNDAGGKVKITSKNKASFVMTDRTDLKAYVVSNETEATLSKTAALLLEGNTAFAKYNLKESSKLKAGEFITAKAELYTSEKVDARVYINEDLSLYAQGKSNIHVYGNPKIDIKGLIDNAKIIKK